MMERYSFDTNKIIEICRQNDVKKVGIFGSMARDESTEKSDVDLIVEFTKRKSLLSMVSLERKMSSAIGRKVDLLTEIIGEATRHLSTEFRVQYPEVP